MNIATTQININEHFSKMVHFKSAEEGALSLRTALGEIRECLTEPSENNDLWQDDLKALYAFQENISSNRFDNQAIEGLGRLLAKLDKENQKGALSDDLSQAVTFAYTYFKSVCEDVQIAIPDVA